MEYSPPVEGDYLDHIKKCIAVYTLRALGCTGCTMSEMTIDVDARPDPDLPGHTQRDWNIRFNIETPNMLPKKVYQYSIPTGPGDLGTLDAMAFIEKTKRA
jgi:hypothetical protein